MSLICVLSAAGSPGGTTTSLGLLASWPISSPASKRLLLEANLDGGVLAIRYELGITPGLVSLGVDERYNLNTDKLFEHTQKLPGGLDVMVAPDSPELVRNVLNTSAQGIAEALNKNSELVAVVDCGRVQTSSPSMELCKVADFVILVSRPEPEKLIPASYLLKELKDKNKSLKVGWALIGNTPYTSVNVEKKFGIQVFGTIADDKKGAKILQNGGSSKKLAKSKLLKTIMKMAQNLSRAEVAAEVASPKKGRKLNVS